MVGRVKKKNLPDYATEYSKICEDLGLSVDPFVMTSLATDWSYLKASNRYSMLPLLELVERYPVLQTQIQDIRLKRATCECHKGHMADANARVISKLIMLCPGIRKVNLYHCGLSRHGAMEIAKALPHTQTLEILDISLNAGSFRGLSDGTFEQGLEENKSLRKLNITNNRLGFYIVNKFRKAMKKSHGDKPFEILDDGNNVFEELLSALTHGLGSLFSIAGSWVLMYHASEPGRNRSTYYGSLIYCCCLVLLFVSSTLLHSTFLLPTANVFFGILDHCAIYFLIAGTYLPFCLISLQDHPYGNLIAIAEWILAAFGILLSFVAERYEIPYKVPLELALYLSMGHLLCIAWDDISNHIDERAFSLLVYGGLAYVVGVLFFIMDKIHHPIGHVIWHLFVLAGAMFHYFAILFYVVEMDHVAIIPVQCINSE